MEQAIDAIAIEVERLSEGQRLRQWLSSEEGEESCSDPSQSGGDSAGLRAANCNIRLPPGAVTSRLLAACWLLCALIMDRGFEKLWTSAERPFASSRASTSPPGA